MATLHRPALVHLRTDHPDTWTVFLAMAVDCRTHHRAFVGDAPETRQLPRIHVQSSHVEPESSPVFSVLHPTHCPRLGQTARYGALTGPARRHVSLVLAQTAPLTM